MRRSLLILTLGLLLVALQPTLAATDCAPAQDCCAPRKPCGQPVLMRLCCTSAPSTSVASAWVNKPAGETQHGPASGGVNSAVEFIGLRSRQIVIEFSSPALAAGRLAGTMTYLLTRRLRL